MNEISTTGSNENPNIKDNDQILERQIQASLVKGKLPCAVAFTIAEKLDVAPGTVGDKVNELKIRITNCQLGCFIVEKATRPGLDDLEIPPALTEGLQASMVNHQVPCQVAFEIAGKLKVSRKRVGDAATKLKIKFINCQLGCF